MTALSMHEPPAPNGILREQVRALGITMRRPLLYAAGYIILSHVVVAVWLFTASRHNPTVMTLWRVSQNSFNTFMYLGVLFPFFVWNGETPSRRMYHVLMPVAREQHALLKTGAGWVWLMFATALAVLLSVIVTILALRSTGVALQATDFNMIGVPFITATVAYLLVSALAIATESPRVWVGVIVASYMVLSGVLQMVEVTLTAQAGSTFWVSVIGVFRDAWHVMVTGDLGIVSALTGRNFASDFTLWAQATTLWLAVALVLTLVAAYRRGE
jgi:hypothetical protein